MAKKRIPARDRPRNDMTADYVRSILDYNHETGEFIWIRRFEICKCVVIWNRKHADKIAGSIKRNGYREISIDHHSYLSHRLAWLYMTGEWPPHEIDHINVKKLDNRFINLREATRKQNTYNRIIRKGNNTGFRGVRFRSDVKKKQFATCIGINGKTINLGYYKTAEEAHEVYKKAVKKYHGEFGRTKGHPSESPC